MLCCVVLCCVVLCCVVLCCAVLRALLNGCAVPGGVHIDCSIVLFLLRYRSRLYNCDRKHTCAAVTRRMFLFVSCAACGVETKTLLSMQPHACAYTYIGGRGRQDEQHGTRVRLDVVHFRVYHRRRRLFGVRAELQEFDAEPLHGSQHALRLFFRGALGQLLFFLYTYVNSWLAILHCCSSLSNQRQYADCAAAQLSPPQR